MAGGVRRRALVDLVVWGAVLGAGLTATAVLLKGHASHLFTQIATPLFMLLLVVVSTLILRWRGETWRSLGLARPRSWGRAVGLALLGYGVMIACNGLVVVFVLKALHQAAPDFSALGKINGHPGLYAYWLAVALLSAGVGEELQFRGFLRSRIEKALTGVPGAAWIAIVAQAILFGAGHLYQGLAGAIVTSIAGLVFGGLYMAAKRNLVPGMMLHALMDTVSLTVLFLVPASALKL